MSTRCDPAPMGAGPRRARTPASLARVAAVCREHPRLLLGFTSLFLWTWTMLQSSFFYARPAGEADAGQGGYTWAFATVIFAVTFAAIGFVSRWADYSLLDPRVLLAALASLIAGGAAAWLSVHADASQQVRSGLFLASAVLIGVATPFYYMEMVRQLLPLRLPSIIVVISACTVLASAACAALSVLPGAAGSLVALASPFGVFAALWPSRGRFSPRPRPSASRLYIPWRLNLTSLAQGMGYEAGFALCVSMNGPAGLPHSLAYMAGYALAAVVLAASASLLRRRFDTLIYKIGFPALALGTLLVPVASAPGFSCFLAAWGYRFVDILIWSLVVYLATTKGVTVNWMAGWSTCFFYLGMAMGQAFTTVMLDLFGAEVGQLAMGLMAFLVLTVGLYATSDANDGDAWGTLRPDGGEAERPFLEAAVRAMAGEAGLTERQAQVLALLCEGRSRADIANELGISRETVKVHMRNVYAAAGVHSQEELVAEARRRERELEDEREG